MRVISKKDGDLLYQFVNNNGNDLPLFENLIKLPPQILDTPQQKS